MGKWKLKLEINWYHLIDSTGTLKPTLSKYYLVRPASGKSPSIQKRLETGITYPPQWPPQKVLTRSRNYCLHINLKAGVFICTCIKLCIAQTSFVTFGLFEFRVCERTPNTVTGYSTKWLCTLSGRSRIEVQKESVNKIQVLSYRPRNPCNFHIYVLVIYNAAVRAFFSTWCNTLCSASLVKIRRHSPVYWLLLKVFVIDA